MQELYRDHWEFLHTHPKAMCLIHIAFMLRHIAKKYARLLSGGWNGIYRHLVKKTELFWKSHSFQLRTNLSKADNGEYFWASFFLKEVQQIAYSNRKFFKNCIQVKRSLPVLRKMTNKTHVITDHTITMLSTSPFFPRFGRELTCFNTFQILSHHSLDYVATLCKRMLCQTLLDFCKSASLVTTSLLLWRDTLDYIYHCQKTVWVCLSRATIYIERILVGYMFMSSEKKKNNETNNKGSHITSILG